MILIAVILELRLSLKEFLGLCQETHTSLIPTKMELLVNHYPENSVLPGDDTVASVAVVDTG